jgi:hypothetical protein
MAVMKSTFAHGRLVILEVLKVQPHDRLILENGDCVIPPSDLPPGDVGPQMVVPCPKQEPQKEPFRQ